MRTRIAGYFVLLTYNRKSWLRPVIGADKHRLIQEEKRTDTQTNGQTDRRTDRRQDSETNSQHDEAVTQRDGIYQPDRPTTRPIHRCRTNTLSRLNTVPPSTVAPEMTSQVQYGAEHARGRITGGCATRAAVGRPFRPHSTTPTPTCPTFLRSIRALSVSVSWNAAVIVYSFAATVGGQETPTS